MEVAAPASLAVTPLLEALAAAAFALPLLTVELVMPAGETVVVLKDIGTRVVVTWLIVVDVVIDDDDDDDEELLLLLLLEVAVDGVTVEVKVEVDLEGDELLLLVVAPASDGAMAPRPRFARFWHLEEGAAG